MKLVNLKLISQNVLLIKAGAVTVVETSPKKNYKTNGRDTIGYDLHCQAHKGDIQKVTIPTTFVKEVDALRKLLQKSPILVNLVESEFKAYAMIDDRGKLISGVTAKAAAFKIIGAVDDGCDEIIFDEEVN